MNTSNENIITSIIEGISADNKGALSNKMLLLIASRLTSQDRALGKMDTLREENMRLLTIIENLTDGK